MSNEVMKKNNRGLHIPVFAILVGFIVLGIYNLLTKDSTAALWLSGIGLAGISTLLFLHTAALIKQHENKED